MVIDVLTPERIDEFYNLFTELMREGYGHFSPKLREYFLNKDYPVQNFRFWLERNIRKIFIALDENKIIGFIVGDNTYGGVAFISWFGVKEEYRKQGIGKKLFNAYEQYIKTRNPQLIELFTFPELQSFYEKLGFIKIGVREQGYYGQTNVIMNKRLGEWSDDNLS